MGGKNTALKGILQKGMEGTETCFCETCGTELVYIDSIEDLGHRSWAMECNRRKMQHLEEIKKERPDLIYKNK